MFQVACLIIAEAVGRQCLFSDGANLRQIIAKKDGGCVLRKLKLHVSTISTEEEKSLQLSQKSVLCLGRSKHDTQETLHTICECA